MSQNPPATFAATMRRLLILFLFWFCTLAIGIGQYTMSGTITDAKTGETIIGASVIPENSGKGTASNAYGFYSLTLPGGSQKITFSFIGYRPQSVRLELSEAKVQNIELEPAVIAFEEATVVGERSSHTESTDVGRESVEVEQIKALPALLGEVDVLKVIQFLPGVSSAGEGNSGF